MTDFARIIEDNTFAATDVAEETYNTEYGIKDARDRFNFHTRIDLKSEPKPEGTDHRHVALEWEGGVVWLDMSVQSDHFCIDIRQFNEDGEMKGQGVFTMVSGYRQSLGGDAATPLVDKHGNPVTGHGWNGGYMMTLMTDLHDEEKAKTKPGWGHG